MKEFEEVLTQYEPMISHSLAKLHIYRDFEQYKQVGRVALWQAWLRFDEQKGNFTPFAYRSIIGAMLDELKRENRFNENVMPAEEEILIYLIGTGNTKKYRWLYDALEELSTSEKELIHWLFFEQYSQAEYAKLVGISVSGVKKRRERLIQKLREFMGIKKK